VEKGMKEQVAEIVSAYVGHNTVRPDQLPTLISSVSEALSMLGQAPPAEEPLIPAVSIRRSVGADAITCLDCGFSGKMIKRHLSSAHDMTPETYRARWKLPADYPLVAPNYATQRSALAKKIGLGIRSGSRTRKRSK
jgi:predicted transcriptional regulator